ncbi:MAG: hypothetical protein KAQ78_09770 [Candidatus Latescibacteria bacterium]|nr:hypothetical protein [Candidatus Latescibacterota bacterium]
MTRPCPKCGAVCESEANYCGKCGEKRVQRLDVGVTQQAMDLTDVRTNLGMVYYKKGAFSQAISMWKKVLEDDPQNAEIQSLIEKAEQENLGGPG